MVRPFPRNVHPVFNQGRRLARAKALLAEAATDSTEAAFVDAAQVASREAFSVAVIDAHERVFSALSVYTKNPEVAEQMAIALALLDPERSVIYSDSRAATRAFARGVVDAKVSRLLEGRCISLHSIVWFPAHMGDFVGGQRNLNESAHRAARGLASRAPLQTPSSPPKAFKDQLQTYNELIKHFYLGRREFSLPNKELNRAQSVTLRLLQTNSYPNPWRMSRIDPDYDGTFNCAQCGGHVNLGHMLWGCATQASYLEDKNKWDGALRSSELQDQLWAVQKAREAAESLGLPVPTWEVPSTP